MNKPLTVAVIMNVHLPFDRKIIRGIASYVRTIGRWSLYVESDPLQKLPDLGEWQGDGLIVDFDDRRVAEAVRQLKIPMVGKGGGGGWYDPQSGIPYLITDGPAIATLAANHLMDQGFKHFAYCGFAASRVNVWSKVREAAFVHYLAEAGYKCHVLRGRHSSPRHWDRLQQELIAWLRELPTPLGLMACNDARARHVLEACRAIGVRVPEDIAVVGVDNDELMCELAAPPITSIEQGAYQLGYEAAALLDKVMHGKQLDRVHYRIGPPSIVPRQSTDVLAVNDPEVASAMGLIRQEACHGLTIKKVAMQIGLSRSTLDIRFKETVNRTVAQEIQRVRLERAKELLSSTDLPQSQVARAAGYANMQYMAALMRKHTGLSPAEYRQDARTGTSAELHSNVEDSS